MPLPTLEFMKNNVVKVGVFPRSGKYSAVCVDKSGYYQIEQGQGQGAFDIYFCGYSHDQTHMIALGSDADFCFTPKMDGCSFAASAPSPDGTVMVGHANIHDGINNPEVVAVENLVNKARDKNKSFETLCKLMDLKRETIMESQQKDLGVALGPFGVNKLLDQHNPSYTSPITTFGIRESGTWKFYFQVANSKTVKGVHEF